MDMEFWTLLATMLMAGATVWLGFSTKRLANSTIDMTCEARKSSVRQLGVQTWLYLAARFDSEEIKRARARLAEQLGNYDPSRHDDITEGALDVFEDLGTVYRLGLINKELADSTFSYYASRWWEVAKTYIYQERIRDDDNEIFCDFEEFAKQMRRPSEEIDNLDLKKFLNDEKQLG